MVCSLARTGGWTGASGAPAGATHAAVGGGSGVTAGAPAQATVGGEWELDFGTKTDASPRFVAERLQLCGTPPVELAKPQVFVTRFMLQTHANTFNY